MTSSYGYISNGKQIKLSVRANALPGLLRFHYNHKNHLRTWTPHRPVMIGLCGGIASGKSTLAHVLRGQFAYGQGRIFDADQVARAALTKNHDLILRRFPFLQDNNDPKATVSRVALQEWIALNPENLDDIEAIIHPLVMRAAIHWLQRAIRQRWRWVVWDIPLLWEKGYAAWCHEVVFLDVPFRTRRRRALKRLPEALYQRLQERQADVTAMSKHCDMRVANGSSPASARSRMTRLWVRHGIISGHIAR